MNHYPRFGLSKAKHLSNVNLRFAGEFQCRVLDGKTREVLRESEPHHNLILNIGLDRIGARQSLANFCRIGTGTTAPTNGDTALQSQSASTSTIVSTSTANAGASTYATTMTVVYEFALGAVVGNMGEVGVGWTASTGSTLFSRALINDVGGSPTTITVLSSEILQVTYRLTVYPQVTDATGTIVISGVTYSYTTRFANAGSALNLSPTASILSGGIGTLTAYTGAIGAVTTTPSGTSASLTAGSVASYTNGTYTMDYPISAAIGVGNLSGGIQSILCFLFTGNTGLGATFQCGFSPNIPKDGTNVLNLTFRLTWQRH